MNTDPESEEFVVEGDLPPLKKALKLSYEVDAGGRPTKRTAERIGRILEAAVQHQTKTACARYGGVSLDTLNRWLERDDEFREQYEAAVIQGEMSLVRIVHKAARTDATKAIWLLKTRYGWKEASPDLPAALQIGTVRHVYLPDNGHNAPTE